MQGRGGAPSGSAKARAAVSLAVSRVSSPLMRPSRMTMRRSAMPSTSGSSLEMTMTQQPEAATSWMIL
jgi:hypothetical protein